jgi:ATP-dependent DNA helicase
MASMNIGDGVSEAMLAEEQRMAAQREKDDAKYNAKLEAEVENDTRNKSQMEKKFQRLEALLNKSKIYSSLILAQMQKEEDELEAANGEQEPVQGPKRRGRKKKATTEQPKISNFFNKKDVESKADADTASEAGSDRIKLEAGVQQKTIKQPKLVTGGSLRDYQLEGLAWLKSLYENGLNGILADEMGLGKTIQTIAFLAFLREMGTNGPFLIAAPLSTTSNWLEEFQKWTPNIPVVLYHGSKTDRAELQRTRLKNPSAASFPVVITSYEICMNDRSFLSSIAWKFVIIVSDIVQLFSTHSCRTKGIESKT